MKFALSLAASLFLAGCASGYSQFYTPVEGADSQSISAVRVAPPPAMPKLDRSGDTPDNIVSAYSRHGYVVIGYSSFNSGRAESEQGALEQGAKVGADVVVVVNPTYTGTVSSVIPMTTPTTQTSYSSGTATAYGAGGTVNAYGSSTTTTYGTNTTYIPMHTNRYDYGALYLVKRRYTLGTHWRDLTDAERQALQTNKGVYILGVVNGTPAFEADILPGDVILSINGQSASDQMGFSKLIDAHRGQTVRLAIFRQGAPITKEVQLAR